MRLGIVRPSAYVALQLPSGSVTVVQALPNTTISIGKYGSFQANDIIGRPYHLTYEIRDKINVEKPTQSGLRVVPASELHAEIKDEDSSTSIESKAGRRQGSTDGVGYEVGGENGEIMMRTNRQIIDDPKSQVMTMEEIETLKAAEGTGSGKNLVAKVLESHSALDQKTAFALAKYTLRKTKKYLKRFTVMPLDVSALARWVYMDKEPMKILELREEILALIGSWSNIHFTPPQPITCPEGTETNRGGRWLVIDEAGGLLVAYMAEKMGILLPTEDEENIREEKAASNPADKHTDGEDPGKSRSEQEIAANRQSSAKPRKTSMPASSNTITLIHANAQPNLSLLKYFHFDAFNPSSTHPLEQHLKTISFLQLLTPEDDMGYTEPATATDENIQSWKSGKRSNYFRKRRRWERIKHVVDETRAGSFDGLIVASIMTPASILRHTVPLLRGAAQVVVYSPTIERLVELVDCYSTGRRTAFVTNPPDLDTLPTEDFPLNPTLLLAPTIQTARCRSWQVLPGRTHPLMTGRGGSNGYVLTATRVIPAEGKIEARGKFKRRKVDAETTALSSQQDTPIAAAGDPPEASQ